MASDAAKPNGQRWVHEDEVLTFLAPLPVSRLWGVGQVTEGVLRKLGVRTIGDLAAFPEQVLAARLGAQGPHLKALARGDDPRAVVVEEPARSIGAEDTFERDLHAPEELHPHLLDQSVRVARRLREAGKRGRVVTLKLKYADFESVTRRRTLPEPTDDGDEIYRSVRSCLSRADLSRPVRLTGVSVSGLEGPPAGAVQGELFGTEAAAAALPDAERTTTSGVAGPPADRQRRSRLNAALDALAARFGEGAVRPATLVAGDVEARRSRVRWPRGRGSADGPGDDPDASGDGP
jgi:DNA polymerase-4